jgi:predicted DNA-binding transcriptional regulator AlpA
VPRGNPNPDTGGLFKSGPVAWDESQVTDFIHCCIKKMPYTAAPLPERPTLIRKREVMRRVGLSYPTIWKMEKQGRFPQRVRIVQVVVPKGKEVDAPAAVRSG